MSTKKLKCSRICVLSNSTKKKRKKFVFFIFTYFFRFSLFVSKMNGTSSILLIVLLMQAHSSISDGKCVLISIIKYLETLNSFSVSSGDSAALQAVKAQWTRFPENWKGVDPCGSNWVGISCYKNKVVSM